MNKVKYIFVFILASIFFISNPIFSHEKPKKNDATRQNFYFNPLRWIPVSMHSGTYQFDQRPNELLFNKKETSLIGWDNRIAINGGVNIQGVFGNRPNTTPFPLPSNNSLNLRAAYFGFTGYLTSWARAYVSLNYEPNSISTATGEPFTAPEMEQAYIQMNNKNRHFRFDLGKQYLPFSIYEHYPVVTTLPQRLSEINKVAAVASVNYHPFFAAAYAFSMQGKLNGYNNPATNALANGGAEIGLHNPHKKFGYEVDLGYMSNMAETRYIYFLIKATHKPVGALSLDVDFNIKRFGVVTSAVYAVQPFSPLDITYDGAGAQPSAYEARINYVIEVHRHPLVPAVGYAQSSQALFLSMPRYTYIFSLEYWIDKYLSTTVEFLQSKNYAAGNVGTYATSATTFGTETGNGNWNSVGILELAAHF
ncbi:MAG TPA: LbtU family siderophore porin [Coxiellaceae bacterium]|nr:MAG: hypothetical protein A3E81_08375 [Gammaproteobacteria bacterium RIFCSPHIGHO2_12_FULL_36_30]HLB55768.1 LbtU family siderophore porin [Coxiellaceae bacterium]